MTIIAPTTTTGPGNLVTMAAGDEVYVAATTTLVATSNAVIYDPGQGYAVINGSIFGSISLQGASSSIVIGSTGSVVSGAGGSGINVGASSTVKNYGFIDAEAYVSNGATYYNSGLGGAALLYNYGTIDGYQAVNASGTSNTASYLYNYGKISGQLSAFVGGSETDIIKNSGQIAGDVLLGAAGSVLDSSFGQVFGTIMAGSGGATVVAGTNGGSVLGAGGDDILQANQSATAAGNHVQFVLDGKGGTNALYGGGAFTTFDAGDANGGHNQIHGGLSQMSDIAGYANNTLDFSGTSIFNSVYVDLLNGHDAYLNSSAAGNGTLTFEDAIQNVPNVIGSQGRDIIQADNTGDRIQGGFGADTLYAGAGNDTFVYTKITDSYVDSSAAHYDTIAGFATGKDKLDLSALKSDPSHLAILNGSNSTTLYLEATPGKFTASTDLAISFTGANAVKASDVIF